MKNSANRPPSGRSGSASGWARATESLSSPAFRIVFISNMAFFLAMGGQTVVRPWLAYELAGEGSKALSLGLVTAATAIPMLLLSPAGGVLADRIERRRLIVLAQSFVILAEAIPLVMLYLDRLEFWHLIVTAAMMGCSFPLMMPARTAIVANIVGRQALGSAMALNMTGVNVTRVLGPAAAGFLISLVDIKSVYLINLALYGFALFAMMGIGQLPPGNAGEVSIMRNLVDGFKYIGGHRLALILLLFGLVPQFLAMPFQSLLPVFSEQVWGMGPFGFGVLHAASGTGAVTGSLFVAGRNPDAGRLRLMMISVILFVGLLAAFAQSPWFWGAVVLVFLANVFASTFSTLNSVSIQLVISDAFRGRVSSFLMMSVSLPLLGTLPIGYLSDRLGAPVAVAGASALAAIASLVFYFSSQNLRDLDAHVKRAHHRE
ncbi:MAG: MFS transporter [Myxococcota bacterium]